MENKEIKHAMEALLFASERPLSLEEMKQAFEEDIPAEGMRTILAGLKEEYEREGRGFKLEEIAGGYQVMTDGRFGPILKRFFQSREKKRISRASLETLSVIAYKQPVTRAEIEFIRGVNVDGALKTLLEKGLVRIVGRKEVPGRPILYGTSKEFLERFGLPSLKELPVLPEYGLKDIEDSLPAGVREAMSAEANGHPIEAMREGEPLVNEDRAESDESSERDE